MATFTETPQGYVGFLLNIAALDNAATIEFHFEDQNANQILPYSTCAELSYDYTDSFEDAAQKIRDQIDTCTTPILATLGFAAPKVAYTDTDGVVAIYLDENYVTCADRLTLVVTSNTGPSTTLPSIRRNIDCPAVARVADGFLRWDYDCSTICALDLESPNEEFVRYFDTENLRFGEDNFALEAEIRLKAFPMGQTQTAIARKESTDDTGSPAWIFVVTLESGNYILRFGLYNAAGTFYGVRHATPLTVGEWTHVAANRIGSNPDDWQLFVNGYENTITEFGSGNTTPINVEDAAHGDIIVGADFDGGSPTATQYGHYAIRQFRVFNRELTDVEISAAAEGCNNEPSNAYGLVLWSPYSQNRGFRVEELAFDNHGLIYSADINRYLENGGGWLDCECGCGETDACDYTRKYTLPLRRKDVYRQYVNLPAIAELSDTKVGFMSDCSLVTEDVGSVAWTAKYGELSATVPPSHAFGCFRLGMYRNEFFWAADPNFRGLNFQNASEQCFFGNATQFNFGTGDFSVECWVKQASNTGIALSKGGLTVPHIFIALDDQIVVRIGDNLIDYALIEYTPLSAIYHFIFSRVGNDANDWLLYVNGALVTHTVTNNNLLVGNITNASSLGFTGQAGIDITVSDLALYDKAMTLKEAEFLYNYGYIGELRNSVIDQNLLFRVPFSEASGTTAAEATATGYSGSLSGFGTRTNLGGGAWQPLTNEQMGVQARILQCSEVIELGVHCFSKLIRYRNEQSNFTYPYDDNAAFYQQTRVGIQNSEFQNKAEQQLSKTSSGQVRLIYARTQKEVEIETDHLDDTRHEALFIALSHDYFAILNEKTGVWENFIMNGDYQKEYPDVYPQPLIAKARVKALLTPYDKKNSFC